VGEKRADPGGAVVVSVQRERELASAEEERYENPL